MSVASATASTPAVPSGQGVAPLLTEGEVARVRDLLEKQAIYENMVKYTRAIDRFDLERIKDAYWPDSTDDHGLSVGSGHDFADVAYARRKDGPLKMCSHLIGMCRSNSTAHRPRPSLRSWW